MASASAVAMTAGLRSLVWTQKNHPTQEQRRGPAFTHSLASTPLASAPRIARKLVALRHRGWLESGALACGQTRGGGLPGFEVGGEVASENLDPTWLTVAAGVGEGRRDWLAELVKLDLQVQRALTAD